MGSTNNQYDPAKKNYSPTLFVLALAVITALSLLLVPSSRTKRLDKALATFNAKYQSKPLSFVQPLLEIELVSGKDFVKVPASKPFAVYVFAPKPGKSSAGGVLGEIIDPTDYFKRHRGEIKTAVLFAPDSASTGWTLLAKVWLARVIAGEPLDDVMALGQRLIQHGSVYVPEVELLWGKIPPTTKRMAESMLENNRSVAKHLGSATRIFHDIRGNSYWIPDHMTMSDFLIEHNRAFSELRQK